MDFQKERYERTVMDIVEFENEDVITASNVDSAEWEMTSQ